MVKIFEAKHINELENKINDFGKNTLSKMFLSLLTRLIIHRTTTLLKLNKNIGINS